MSLFRKYLCAVAAGLMALAAPVAHADVYLWSQTPANNTNSDIGDDINLVEGMAPSEVNDSMRAVMSEIKKWIDDQGAVIPSATLMTTSGTANAQTLTTNATSSVLTHGWKVCFIVGSGLTNTSAATLNVDSQGAIAVQGVNGTALAGGELAENTQHCAVYDSNDTVWQLENYRPIDATSIVYSSTGVMRRAALSGDVAASVGSNTLTIQAASVEASMLDPDVYTKPIGEVFDFAGGTCPSKSLSTYGQNVSRTTYSDLFAVIGTTHGVGDGSTTFGLPDFRDRVIVGDANQGGVDAALISTYTTTTLGGTGGAGTHTLTTAETPSHTHSFSATTGSNSVGHTHTWSATSGGISANHTHTWSDTSSSDSHSHGGAATRSSQNANTGNDRYSVTASTSTDSDSHSHSVSGTTSFVSADHTHFSSGTTSGVSANHTHSVSGTTGSTGSGGAHNNVQPFIVMTKCIYVGQQGA